VGYRGHLVHQLPWVAVSPALSNPLLLIPSEPITLPVAGSLRSRRPFPFSLVLGPAIVGSSVSALILYAVGRRPGEQRLRRFIEWFGQLIGRVGKCEVDKVSKRFYRHGGQAVPVGRLFPGMRNLVSVPTGIERMSVWRFAVYSTPGHWF